MRVWIKKITAALLVSVMIVSLLASCTDSKKEPDPIIPENVYAFEEIILPEEVNDMYNIKASGTKITFTYYDEEWNNGFATYDIATKEFVDIPNILSNESYLSGYEIDSEGNIYLLTESWSYNEETYESTANREFIKLDSTGKELERIDVDELFKDYGQNFYINTFKLLSDGRIIILAGQTLVMLDSNFSKLFDIKTEEYLEQMVCIGDKIIVTSWDDTALKSVARLVDTEKKEIVKDESLANFPTNIYNSFVGIDGKLYTSDNFGISTYDITTGTEETVVDFLNSDLTVSYLNSVTPYDEKSFICYGYDYAEESNMLFKLTEKDPSEITPKIPVTMSAMYLDYSLRRAISKFNRESEEYRILLTDYSTVADDYEACLTQFNNDIVMGKVTDIVVVNSEMPFDSYVSKGLFYDLYEKFDSDDEIKREDYLQNILKAFEVNGKLYSISPYYYISTAAGLTRIFGEEPTLSFEKLKAIMQANPDSTLFNDEYMIKSDIFNQLFYANYNNFVNKDTGECNFDCEDFRTILEIANLGREVYAYEEDGYYDDYDWEEADRVYRDGKVLLTESTVYSLSSSMYYTFRDDYNYVGFPNSESYGALISPTLELAIYSQSRVSDAAWEFVKYIIGEEFQSSISYEIPILESRLYEIRDEELERIYEDEKNYYYESYGDDDYFFVETEIAVEEVIEVYEEELIEEGVSVEEGVIAKEEVDSEVDTEMDAELDVYTDMEADKVVDNGTMEPFEETVTMESTLPDISVDVETEEYVPDPETIEKAKSTRERREHELEQVMQVILTADQLARRNEKIYNVIKEETDAFFAGDKSMDETIRLIQSRVQIIVNESR